MKNLNIFFTVLLLLFSMTINAQETVKPLENYLTDGYCEFPHTYYKDTNGKLQNCVGTWVYDNGTDYFKITFTKAKVLVNQYHHVYVDRLSTKFLYKKNNIVIYDNYNTTVYTLPAVVNVKPSEIKSDFVKSDEIYLSYTEPSSNDCHRRRVGDLTLVYLNNAVPQMQWTRTTDEHYFDSEPCENGLEPDNSDFIIPADMVLTRVN
jgi:hypothetical protein